MEQEKHFLKYLFSVCNWDVERYNICWKKVTFQRRLHSSFFILYQRCKGCFNTDIFSKLSEADDTLKTPFWVTFIHSFFSLINRKNLFTYLYFMFSKNIFHRVSLITNCIQFPPPLFGSNFLFVSYSLRTFDQLIIVWKMKSREFSLKKKMYNFHPSRKNKQFLFGKLNIFHLIKTNICAFNFRN